MDLPPSTFYDDPACRSDDTAVVEAIGAICEEFEHYGWRRVRAALCAQGLVVNHKKIRRLRLKALMRAKAERTVEALWKAVGTLIPLFQSAECANYFKAAGYDAD